MVPALVADQGQRIAAGPDEDMDLDAEHAWLVKTIDSAMQVSMAQHELASKCRAYVNGQQWTEAEIAVMKRRGQSPTVFNQIYENVEWHKGYERQNRSDPNAYPRNPADEAAATAATQALRYIVERTKFDEKASIGAEHLLVEGEFAFDVTAVPGRDPRTGDETVEIDITMVAPDRLIRDPLSRQLDAHDAAYVGIADWMDRNDVLRQFPGSEDVLESTWGTFDRTDRVGRNWCDSGRTRVRVVQIHYRRGDDWWIARLTKGGFLEPPKPSPYVDDQGRHISSLVVRGLYMDEDRHRFGKVKHWLSPQDSVNKLTSKYQHLVNSQQFKYTDGALDDPAATARELHNPQGRIKVNPGFDFQLLEQNGARADRAMQMLQIQLGNLRGTGPSPALMGDAARDASGRAIQAAQQGGEVQYRPFLDANIQMRREVYEHAWLIARQYWTEERWVRVTDDDNKPKFVGINQVTTIGDYLRELGPQSQTARRIIARLQLEGPQDPRLQQQIKVNSIAQLDVDILVQESQDVATLQQEQFDSIVGLVRERLVTLPPKAIISLSSLRNKEKVLGMLEQGPPPEVQQMQQQMQAQQQALQAAQQEIERLRNRAMLDVRKVENEAYGKETDRLKILAPATDPMQIARMAAQMAVQILQGPDIAPGLGQPMPAAMPNQGPQMPMGMPAQGSPLPGPVGPQSGPPMPGPQNGPGPVGPESIPMGAMQGAPNQFAPQAGQPAGEPPMGEPTPGAPGEMADAVPM